MKSEYYYKNEQEGPSITEKGVFSAWWWFTWRGMLISMLLAVIIGLIMGIFLYIFAVKNYNTLYVTLFGLVLSLSMNFYFFRMMIKKGTKKYNISLVEKE